MRQFSYDFFRGFGIGYTNDTLIIPEDVDIPFMPKYEYVFTTHTFVFLFFQWGWMTRKRISI